MDAALAGSGAEASCATSTPWLCFAENRVRWQVLFGEIGGWPNPGMGSAVASGDWSPTMGEAKMQRGATGCAREERPMLCNACEPVCCLYLSLNNSPR